MTDSASNIVVQRLTDLNGALTKAKTERINKEALYNQLKAAESSRHARHLPCGARERLHPEAPQRSGRPAAAAGAVGRALRRTPRGDDQDPHGHRDRGRQARGELGKIVESVKNEYKSALARGTQPAAAHSTRRRPRRSA